MTELKGWEKAIKKAVMKRRLEKANENAKHHHFDFQKLKQYISIPIIIGLVAAFLFYFEFGWEDLKHVLLSWLIGITLVATLIASLLTRFEKR